MVVGRFARRSWKKNKFKKELGEFLTKAAGAWVVWYRRDRQRERERRRQRKLPIRWVDDAVEDTTTQIKHLMKKDEVPEGLRVLQGLATRKQITGIMGSSCLLIGFKG